jgi:murein DD-endopeptidase MepM/ murein hydrolase activator NlpD
LITSALGIMGASAVGAVQLRSSLLGPAPTAGAAENTLGGSAVASEPADRLRLEQRGAIAFPVLTDTPIVVLDNFGGYSTRYGCGGHRGVDIFRADAEPGQPLLACVDGVLIAQRFDAPGQGNAWVIEDVNGDIYRYHHLDTFAPGLAEGDRVQVGDVLGTMGSSGNASPSGPHLHFEVRRGSWSGPAEDPVPLFGLPLLNVELRAVGGC